MDQFDLSLPISTYLYAANNGKPWTMKNWKYCCSVERLLPLQIASNYAGGARAAAGLTPGMSQHSMSFLDEPNTSSLLACLA